MTSLLLNHVTSKFLLSVLLLCRCGHVVDTVLRLSVSDDVGAIRGWAQHQARKVDIVGLALVTGIVLKVVRLGVCVEVGYEALRSAGRANATGTHIHSGASSRGLVLDNVADGDGRAEQSLRISAPSIDHTDSGVCVAQWRHTIFVARSLGLIIVFFRRGTTLTLLLVELGSGFVNAVLGDL